MTWALRPDYTLDHPQARDTHVARIDPLIFDKDGLAQLFGCSTNVIDGWIRAGMPVHVRGAPGIKYQFRSADVLKWVRAQERVHGTQPVYPHPNGGTPTHSGPQATAGGRDRAAEAAADLKELELAEKLRQVLPRQVLFDQVQSEYTEVRTRLGQIASRVAAQLAASSDPSECERLVTAEIDEAMADMSADLPSARWAEGE